MKTNLNDKEIIYCAAFPANTQDITHWLIEINGIMSYSTNKVAEVLLPSENVLFEGNIEVYCAAYNYDNIPMHIKRINQQKQELKFPCCIDLFVELMTSQSELQSSDSNLITTSRD